MCHSLWENHKTCLLGGDGGETVWKGSGPLWWTWFASWRVWTWPHWSWKLGHQEGKRPGAHSAQLGGQHGSKAVGPWRTQAGGCSHHLLPLPSWQINKAQWEAVDVAVVSSCSFLALIEAYFSKWWLKNQEKLRSSQTQKKHVWWFYHVGLRWNKNLSWTINLRIWVQTGWRFF